MSDTVQTMGALSGEAEDKARAKEIADRRRRKTQLQNLGIRLLSLVCVLGIWEIFGGMIDPVLFTVPSKIAVAAVGMIASGELWNYLWPSLVVLAVGLILAAIIGIAIGLLLARFRLLDVAFGSYITFLYSIPSVALVPLIVLWAGFEMTAKIIILFMFAFFPMVINTYQGVRNVDAKLLEVGRAFRCSERQLWANIVLPAALPFIVTGVRLALGRDLRPLRPGGREHAGDRGRDGREEQEAVTRPRPGEAEQQTDERRVDDE